MAYINKTRVSAITVMLKGILSALRKPIYLSGSGYVRTIADTNTAINVTTLTNLGSWNPTYSLYYPGSRQAFQSSQRGRIK